ncbi:MAG: PAS domain S-box protein [Halarcobacter sp.]
MKEFNQRLHLKVIFIAIPLSLMLIFFVFRYSENTFLKSYISHINSQYILLEDRINNFLIDKDAFMSLLISHNNIQNFLKNQSEKNQIKVEQLFLKQVKIQKNIMQLRIVSAKGMELIRVDRVENNNIKIIEKKDLQDKSNRDYFKRFVKLKPNNMGVSSLDLNVERGKIEIPFKATLRVSMPIYRQNKLQALIIINYNMNEWLDEFEKVAFLKFYMVDKDGYFILHPNKNLQWSKYQKDKLNIKDKFNLDVKTFLDTNKLIKVDNFLGRKLKFFNNEENIILYDLDTDLGLTNYLYHSKLLGIALFISILLILLPFSKILYEYFKKLKALNLELVNNEDKIKRILDNTFDAIIMINQKGIIQSANNAAQKIFLYEKSELIGKNVNIIVPEPHHSNHDSYLKKHDKQMKTKVIGLERELFGCDKSGNLIPVNIAITKLQIKDELFFIGTIRDLRDEKRSKKLFQNVFDNTPLGMALVLKDGSFWQLNNSFCNIVGYSNDELKHLTFQDITYADDLNIDLELVQKLINKESDSYSLEKRYIHKDGHIVWVNLNVTPFFMDENKTEIDFFIAAIEDITKKKEIISNLELTKDRLLEAEEVSQTGHWDWNAKEDYLYWSDVMLRIFGKTKDSFKENYEDFIACVYEEDREFVDASIKECFKSNKPYNLEYRILVNEKIKYIKAQGKVIYHNDIPIKMFGTCQDVTELKILIDKEKKQEYLIMQQAKLVSMGEMVAAIAHQWRQPLNSIGLAIQDILYAYKYGEVDESYLKNLKDEVMGQLNYMSQTIDEFRSFFKKSNIVNKFNIVNAMEEIKTFYRAQLTKSKIHLNIKCKVDSEYILIEDLEKNEKDKFIITSKVSELKQIVINFISNAKDAIEKLDSEDLNEKQIELIIEKQNDKIKISVNDFAGGIDKKNFHRVFEPYFSTKEMGTGLGLYIAKMIIEKSLKGEIEHKNIETQKESKVYKGSSFFIILPLSIDK